MNRIASKKLQSHKALRAEWPSNAEHLDALDRELALINCTKIWIDGATAGVTPRTSMRENKKLLDRRTEHSKKNKGQSNTNAAASPPNSRPGSPNEVGASIFVYTTSQMKKLTVVDKRRHEFVQQSCRNFALQVTGLKKSLRKDLEALSQSVIQERPIPLPKRTVPDGFIMSTEFDDDENNEDNEDNEFNDDDEDAIQLPEGWNDIDIELTLPSPREDPFGRSRHAQSILRLPPLQRLQLLQQKDNKDMVVVSKRGPFGLRASGKLLRPSIISMDPSNRLDHVRKVLPGIVQSISDKIINSAIHECKSEKRLRPIPHVSERAATIFSKSFDAVVTKQKEAITTLASSQIRDIFQKLRKELNTVKAVQSSLGATWMMLIAFTNRHQFLGRVIVRARAKGKLNRAAFCIQAAIRSRKKKLMAAKIDVVRPMLKRNVWWFVLKMKTKMRRRHAILLRQFVSDYVGGVGVQQIIYKFRWKVIQTQKTVRAFLACKKARMLALQLFWDQEEKKEQTQKVLSILKRAATASPGSSMISSDVSGGVVPGNKNNNGGPEVNDITIEESVVPRETFQKLASSFHTRYLKTNSVLLRASMARLGNSKALAEIEALGKWSKWRGGYFRVCSKDVMREVLEPFLLIKRRLYIQKKNVQADKIGQGVQAHDMMAFMQGESWEELAERIKPPPVPWMLFTNLRKSTDMLNLIKSGLLEQLSIDAAMEVQKLQLL